MLLSTINPAVPMLITNLTLYLNAMFRKPGTDKVTALLNLLHYN
jgi:hypothetical protein